MYKFVHRLPHDKCFFEVYHTFLQSFLIYHSKHVLAVYHTFLQSDNMKSTRAHEKEEKVCLTKTQMDNILDADRALITGQTKGACPKAIDWLRGYRPIQKNKKKEKDVETAVTRRIRQIREKIMDRTLDKIFGV